MGKVDDSFVPIARASSRTRERTPASPSYLGEWTEVDSHVEDNQVQIRDCSHLHGGTILRHDFPDEFRDLTEALAAIETPLRRAGPFTETGRPKTPKRQLLTVGGRRANCLFPIDQDRMNKAIAVELRNLGWSSEPIAAAGLTVPTSFAGSGLLGDFVKGKVFVEVEFGNVASMYRDVFKFQIANRSGAGDVGVLVAGTQLTMKFCDQGVTTYEAAERMLPYLGIGIQMPIMVVGLEPDDWSTVKRRYDEMYLEATSHRIECHEFETVYGAALDPAVESQAE